MQDEAFGSEGTDLPLQDGCEYPSKGIKATVFSKVLFAPLSQSLSIFNSLSTFKQLQNDLFH